MPISRKRKTEPKDLSQQKHINVSGTKGGKLLILILTLSMVAGIVIAAIVLMAQYLG